MASPATIQGLLGRKATSAELKDLDRGLNALSVAGVLELCSDEALTTAMREGADAHWEVVSRVLSRMVVAQNQEIKQAAKHSITGWLADSLVLLLRTAKGHQQVRKGPGGLVGLGDKATALGELEWALAGPW
jgi:hypothetical protein